MSCLAMVNHRLLAARTVRCHCWPRTDALARNAGVEGKGQTCLGLALAASRDSHMEAARERADAHRPLLCDASSPVNASERTDRTADARHSLLQLNTSSNHRASSRATVTPYAPSLTHSARDDVWCPASLAIPPRLHRAHTHCLCAHHGS